MAPGVDLEARLVGQLRPRPAALGGARGMARGDVDPGDRLGGRGDRRRRGNRQRGQLLGMRGLGGQRVAAGLDHPRRLGVQVGRIEAHHPGQRLAMGEARPAPSAARRACAGNLDMIAEHRIVADLERRDAGRLAVAAFERGNRPPPIRRRGAQRVQRGVIALGDIAALRRIERRRRDQRRGQSGDQRVMPAKPRQQVVEQRRAGRARRPARPAAPRAAASPSRSSARSRGLPRRAASRASARAKSGIAFSATRTRSRRSASSCSQATSASRASIAARSVSGAAMSSASSAARRPRSGSGRSRRAGCRPRRRTPSGSARGFRGSPHRSPHGSTARSAAARRAGSPAPFCVASR